MDLGWRMLYGSQNYDYCRPKYMNMYTGVYLKLCTLCMTQAKNAKISDPPQTETDAKPYTYGSV